MEQQVINIVKTIIAELSIKRHIPIKNLKIGGWGYQEIKTKWGNFNASTSRMSLIGPAIDEWLKEFTKDAITPSKYQQAKARRMSDNFSKCLRVIESTLKPSTDWEFSQIKIKNDNIRIELTNKTNNKSARIEHGNWKGKH